LDTRGGRVASGCRKADKLMPLEMPCWVDSFAEFCGRFDDLFARSKTREQARKYVRGLLAPLERKTSRQLSRRLHDSAPDRMQRLLYRVAWDAEEARDRLQQFIIERFGEPEATGVLDETGIAKKGTASVGVAKQYCGAVGKLENCQVATRLPYSTSGGLAGNQSQRPRICFVAGYCWYGTTRRMTITIRSRGTMLTICRWRQG
jgi:SRSO17 transposase